MLSVPWVHPEGKVFNNFFCIFIYGYCICNIVNICGKSTYMQSLLTSNDFLQCEVPKISKKASLEFNRNLASHLFLHFNTIPFKIKTQEQFIFIQWMPLPCTICISYPLLISVTFSIPCTNKFFNTCSRIINISPLNLYGPKPFSTSDSIPTVKLNMFPVISRSEKET